MKSVSGLDVHKDTVFACILSKGKPPIVKEYTVSGQQPSDSGYHRIKRYIVYFLALIF